MPRVDAGRKLLPSPSTSPRSEDLSSIGMINKKVTGTFEESLQHKIEPYSSENASRVLPQLYYVKLGKKEVIVQNHCFCFVHYMKI